LLCLCFQTLTFHSFFLTSPHLTSTGFTHLTKPPADVLPDDVFKAATCTRYPADAQSTDTFEAAAAAATNPAAGARARARVRPDDPFSFKAATAGTTATAATSKTNTEYPAHAPLHSHAHSHSQATQMQTRDSFEAAAATATKKRRPDTKATAAALAASEEESKLLDDADAALSVATGVAGRCKRALFSPYLTSRIIVAIKVCVVGANTLCSHPTLLRAVLCVSYLMKAVKRC
jgi:hypothetical protein